MKLRGARIDPRLLIVTFGNAFAMGNGVQYLKEMGIDSTIVDHWTLRVDLPNKNRKLRGEVLKAIKRAEGYVESDPRRIVKKSKAKGLSPLDYPVFG